MIGKIVKVIVDRKLGSVHPKCKDIIIKVAFQEQFFDVEIIKQNTVLSSVNYKSAPIR